MNGVDILALPMFPTDSDATTIGGYLVALLRAVWKQGELFHGHPPFDGWWSEDLFIALILAGCIDGEVGEDDGRRYLDFIDEENEEKGDALIVSAIEALLPGTQNHRPTSESEGTV